MEPQAFTITVGQEAIWQKAAETMFGHLLVLQAFIKSVPESAENYFESYDESVDTVMRSIDSVEVYGHDLIEVYAEESA